MAGADRYAAGGATGRLSRSARKEIPSMQACVYEQYGPAETVRLAEVATPIPKADEVLVRVRASAVTTADWRLRTSVFPTGFWLAGRLMLGLVRPRNRVLGMDFAGVVEAVGKRVTRFRVGEAIFGSTHPLRRGAHAEYLTVAESGAVLHKPEFLSDTEAAAVPFGANCALAFLRDVVRLRAGQRVLVVGASGGVGVWAVQLARHFGAEVTGVCSARNVELVRSLGARRVIDYGSESITSDGAAYDVIFDTVGVTRFADCRSALAEKGIYIPLNSGLREIVQALVTSRSAGKRVKFAISENTREALESIVRLIEAGSVKPIIDDVYPSTQIAEAHRHVESRHKRGSVIIAL
jgi:NADPH:quinone reductase-like Zn-dependent oxidoreductase